MIFACIVKLKERLGFTMLDLLMSLAILTVGLTSALPLFVTAQAMVKRAATKQTIAFDILDKEINAVLNWKLDVIDTLIENPSMNQPKTIEIEGYQYLVTKEYSYYEDDYNMLQVTVKARMVGAPHETWIYAQRPLITSTIISRY